MKRHRTFQIAIWISFFAMILYGCGGGGGSTTSNPENIKPIADAGESKIVQPGTEVILDGSLSHDDDGEIVSYKWVQTNGSAVTLIDADQASARFVAPETQIRESLDFELTVKDNAGALAKDIVPITVNLTPIVDAGTDQSLNISTPNVANIVLNGSAMDNDGTIEAHEWVQIAGDTVTLMGADTPRASFSVPAVTQAYTFSYTATDDDGVQATDTVSVYITQILVSDSFTDTSGWGAVWTIKNDTAYWTVDGGQLFQRNYVDGVQLSYQTGTYAVLAYPPVALPSSYRFSVDITPIPNNGYGDTEGNDVGIMFQYVDANNYYRVSMNARNGFTRFEKRRYGSFQTLAVNSIGYIENQTITMTVDVSGNKIFVLIDGDPIFSMVDPDPLTGTVALYCQDGTRFDNVLITDSSLAPMAAISTPLAYSIALTPDAGNTLDVEAVVMNKPSGADVYFDLDGGSEIVAAETGGYYTARFSDVTDGNHDVTVIMRDASGKEISADVNSTVGVGGDYYVTLGDSITNGEGDGFSGNNDSADGRIVARQGYQAVLADELTSATGRPHIVFNEGLGGDTAAGLQSRIISILERHPKANKILMMIGTNDSSAGITADNYETSVRAVANTIANVYGKQLWIAKPPPTHIYGSTTVFDYSRNAVIELYNQRINEIATDGIYPDTQLGPNFYTLLTASYYFNDYLHPNDTGYQKMAYEWSLRLP